MPKIKKFAPKLTTNLTNIQTFIVDEVYDSQYFKITEFKNTFTGGKNGFLIEGSPFLKETTEVKLEILDANGNPVYYEIAKGNPQYYESTSILVAVYIYNDTPVGPAKITILGEAKTYNDNGVVRNIPDEWDGVYNVKWEREFKINRNLPNIDRVRFKYRPEIAVSELSGSVYLTQITEIVQEGFVNGYPITPEVGTVLANKYYGDILYKLIKTGSGINKVPAIDKPFWESNNQFDIIPQFDYYLLEKCNRDIGDDNVYYLSNPETVFGNLQNPIIPYNQSLNLKIADDTGPDYYTLVNVMKLSQYDESLLSPVVSTGPVASIDITSPTYPFVYGCDGTLQPGFLPSPTLLNTNQIIGTTTTPTQTVLSVVISVYTQIENDGGNDILRAYATIVPSVPQEVVITTSVSYSSPLGGIADYGFTITVPPSTVLANSDGYDTGLTNVTIQSSCLNGHDFIENANVTVINPCSGYIPQPFIPIPNPSPESTEAEDLSDGGLFPGQSILGAKITIPSASIYDEPIFQFLNDTELVIQKPYLVNGSVNEFNTFDYSLTFNTITNFNTSSLGSSYGNFRINNLNTYVGDVSRVKIYYKPTRDIVQYELLNDVKIESTELLKEEFSGSFVEYGNFTSSYIDYWVTSSNTNYEVSTSNDTVFAGISIESISPTTESFKLQTSESFSFFKDEEYTFFTNIKYSGTLGDDVYFKVYLSGSSFYSGSEQDILILNPLPKNKNQQRLEKNVIIRETGDYHLIIETFGDRWDFGGVSFKSAQDNYFSPDYVDFNIPIPRQRPEEYFDFKFEFYDVNNNYIPTDLFVNKILFKEGKSVIPINSDDLAGIVEDLVDDVNELQNVVTNKPIYKYGEILFGTGTTIISQSADLYWDIPNRRLGVGRKDPQYNVDVIGSVRITDDLIVEGRITAQEYYTEYVSSSIIFESGSTKFGNSNDDTHIFTGSLSLLGDESIDGFLYVNDLPMYQQQLNDMFTGVVSGGIITINPLNGQVFDISEGSGYIVNNYTDPINPTYQYVTWGNLSVSASAFPSFGSNATTPRTNIAINSDGTVHQQTAKFTPQDYREKIVLGRIAHGNTNVINRTLSLPLTTYNRGFHWFDLANSIGPLNVNGNVYSAGSTNLTIQKSAGQTYRVGSNYKNDTTFPDITTDISSNPTEFRYRYRNGSGLFIEEPLSTQITGSRYDNGSGTLQTVNNNQWTVQRIFFFGATRTTIIQFGQNVYNNRIDAELSTFSEQFETDPNLLDDSILRAYLLIRGGATNLSNLNDGEFLEAAVGGGSGGGSVTIPTTTYTGINPIVVTSSVDINGDISVTISHTESGVTPGTYNSVTVDAYGHITSGSIEEIPTYGVGQILFGDSNGLPTSSTDLYYNTQSGIFEITGSVDITGGLTASLQEGYVWIGNSDGRNIEISTASLLEPYLLNSEFNSYTQSTDGRLDSIESKTGSYATTGSNIFEGNQIVNGDLFVSGTFTSSLQNGYMWIGDENGVNIQIPTTSFVANPPISLSIDYPTNVINIYHTESGVTPGTYNSLTVDVYGHITSGSVEITGHTIQDSGSDLPQQENLNFIRMIVEDDATNNATIVKRPPSVVVSGSAPTEDLMEGDEWINNETWKKYVRYDGYWVETGKVDCSTLLVYPFTDIEMVESNSNTIKFDRFGGYIHGNDGALSGTLTFDFTSAIRGSIVNILYNHTSLSLPSSVIIISGYFSPSVDNYITLQLVDKTVGSEVIWATISQEL